MPIGSIAAVILLGFALRATIISATTNTQSDDKSSCCLCDSCHAVPLEKEQVILLHNHHHLGNTCWELDLSLKEQRSLDLQECTIVKRDYEIVCCTQGFQGIDIFDLHANGSSRKQQEVDSSNGSTLFASYFRAARELWQASSTSWKPQTSALSIHVPSDSSDRQPSITHSVTNSSTGERSSSWGASSAFGNSFFSPDSSESSSRPSVRVRTETRVIPSTNSSSNNNNNRNRNRSNHNRTNSTRSDSDNDSSSNNNNRSDDINNNSNNRSDSNRTDSKPDSNRTRSSPWQGNTDRTNNHNTIDRNTNQTDASRGNRSPSSTGPDDSSTHSRNNNNNNNNNRTGSGNNNNTSHASSNTTMGNFAEQGSTAYWSDHSGDVVTVTCTYEPVGVRFQTPGGNYGFGICRDGSRPTAVAQGAAIWDPNENKMFRGDCQMIDQLTRDGYLSNNMCRITQLHLHSKCCNDPEYTANSLAESWSEESP